MQLFPASTPQQHDQNLPVGFETPSSIVYAYAVQSVYPARSRAQKPGTHSSCSRAVAAFTIVWTCSRGHGYCEPGLSRSASKNIDVLSSLARRTWTEDRRHLRGSGVYGPPPEDCKIKFFHKSESWKQPYVGPRICCPWQMPPSDNIPGTCFVFLSLVSLVWTAQ